VIKELKLFTEIMGVPLVRHPHAGI